MSLGEWLRKRWEHFTGGANFYKINALDKMLAEEYYSGNSYNYIETRIR